MFTEPLNPESLITSKPFREVVLHRIRYACQSRIDPEALCSSLQIQVQKIEYIGEMLAVNLVCDILADPPTEIHCEWPDGWWQAFRHRWAPRWWLARYPVRMVRKTLEARTIYPALNLPEQRFQPFVKMAIRP